MLILDNEKRNVKKKYFVLHHNEIFVYGLLDMAIARNNIEIIDVTQYDITQESDYYLFEYTGELELIFNELLQRVFVIYSKMNIKELIKDYNQFLITEGLDMEIKGSII